MLAEGNITQANLTGPLAGQPFSSLIDNMTNGSTYVNVHTIQNPAGEIRGQIQVAQPSNVT
ncbi:CHRD domain protein (fragment) [Candidatus Methanoperedens nitroreducens]|uniref:CHRD domain protein n=1 Tax=Candidatus Methanoperedens nitratireducens TaxID=1392998 RepID=A0A284VMV9_9EURY